MLPRLERQGPVVSLAEDSAQTWVLHTHWVQWMWEECSNPQWYNVLAGVPEKIRKITFNCAGQGVTLQLSSSSIPPSFNTFYPFLFYSLFYSFQGIWQNLKTSELPKLWWVSPHISLLLADVTGCLGQRKSSSPVLLLTGVFPGSTDLFLRGCDLLPGRTHFAGSRGAAPPGSVQGSMVQRCCSWLKEWETQSTRDRRGAQQGWAWEPRQSSHYQPKMSQSWEPLGGCALLWEQLDCISYRLSQKHLAGAARSA